MAHAHAAQELALLVAAGSGENLGPGHDEIYVRWYQKFDDNYRNVQNHGGNLGGRDLQMPNAAWVGMAAAVWVVVAVVAMDKGRQLSRKPLRTRAA